MNLLIFALLAWQTPIDEGTLVVREDTAVIARESFRLSGVRSGAGGGAWTLASTIRYARPLLVLAPILEIGADSQPSSFEFDVADPNDPQRIRATGPRAIHGPVAWVADRAGSEFPVLGRMPCSTICVVSISSSLAGGEQDLESVVFRPARGAGKPTCGSGSGPRRHERRVWRHVTIPGRNERSKSGSREGQAYKIGSRRAVSASSGSRLLDRLLLSRYLRDVITPSARIPMRHALRTLGLVLCPSLAAGQSVPAKLSLADAITLARQYSPGYRQALNDRGPAAWGARNAYASLLPSLSASGGLGYTGPGTQRFLTSDFSQTVGTWSTNYNLGVN